MSEYNYFTNKHNFAVWATINWTELNEAKHQRLMCQFRSGFREDEPMWHLETYWLVTAESPGPYRGPV